MDSGCSLMRVQPVCTKFLLYNKCCVEESNSYFQGSLEFSSSNWGVIFLD